MTRGVAQARHDIGGRRSVIPIDDRAPWGIEEVSSQVRAAILKFALEYQRRGFGCAIRLDGERYRLPLRFFEFTPFQ